MDWERRVPQLLSRRELLCRAGMGMGAIAMSNMVGSAFAGDDKSSLNPLQPRRPHFAAKAKRVIHIFLNGGPSHVDTFDPKPSLARYAGKPLPIENYKTERKTGNAFPSMFKWAKYGNSGLEVSELFKHTAQMADDLCVIRSMHTDIPNHEPGLRCRIQSGRRYHHHRSGNGCRRNSDKSGFLRWNYSGRDHD